MKRKEVVGLPKKNFIPAPQTSDATNQEILLKIWGPVADIIAVLPMIIFAAPPQLRLKTGPLLKTQHQYTRPLSR